VSGTDSTVNVGCGNAEWYSWFCERCYLSRCGVKSLTVGVLDNKKC
jgi:hypothetical protein